MAATLQTTQHCLGLTTATVLVATLQATQQLYRPNDSSCIGGNAAGLPTAAESLSHDEAAAEEQGSFKLGVTGVAGVVSVAGVADTDF